MATGQIFSRTTQALFYNYKQLPIQRMLDFDFLCGMWNYAYTLFVTELIVVYMFVKFQLMQFLKSIREGNTFSCWNH